MLTELDTIKLLNGAMEAQVTIHIRTEGFRVIFLQRLAQLIGATVTVEKTNQLPLRQVIDEAEADFATGRGKNYTMEELEAMMNEHA